MSSVVVYKFTEMRLAEALSGGWKAVHVDRRRFGTESNLICLIEPNRSAEGGTQEGVMSVGWGNHNPNIPSLVVGLLAAALSLGSALVADFAAPVVSILDGDTLEVLSNNRAERTRLNGIDCPEKASLIDCS